MRPAVSGKTGGTRAELQRWGAAAAVVAAVHASAVAGYILLHKPALPAGGTPIVMVELAPAPAAPQIETLDIPEEKPAEQAELEPEPEVVKPLEEKPPPEPPTPVSPVSVAEPPPPKPKPKPKKPPAPRTVAAARAPNRAETPTATSTAIGVAEGRAARATWGDLVRAHIERNKRYPSGSQSQGTVRVSFTVDRSGHVLNRRITQSSGSRDIDEDALATVVRAQPLPAFPPGMTQAREDVGVSLRYAPR
jgi:protein TonB